MFLKTFSITCFTFLLHALYSPVFAFNSEVFYAMLKKPTPQWMLEQIEEDLTPHTTKLSKQFIDELFFNDANLCLVRVRVTNGELSIQKSPGTTYLWTPDMIIPHLYALNELVTIPDIDFLFTSHDGIPSHLPVFCVTKYILEGDGVIVMPDMFGLKGFEPDKTEMLEGNQRYPWDCKIEIAFYRGADFCNIETSQDISKWLDHPRPKLVALSSQYPNLIDAKFRSLYAKCHEQQAIELGFMGNHVSIKDHPRYKYLMNVEAGCANTPRLALLLHSNSVVFKNTTNSILWFYLALKPYQHFIPVREDLSDLLDQLKWAKDHDEECRKISENARQLASEILSHEAVYLYLYRLLEAYSNKQKKYYMHIE